MSYTSSEAEAGLDLHDARLRHLSHLPEIPRVDVALDDQVVPQVQRVQHVEPELQLLPAPNGEGFGHRGVEVAEAWAAELAVADIAGPDRLARQRAQRHRLKRRLIQALPVVESAAACVDGIRGIDDIGAAARSRR